MLTQCPLSKQPAGLRKLSEAAYVLVWEEQSIPDGHIYLIFKQIYRREKGKICIQVIPNSSGKSCKAVAFRLPRIQVDKY